MRRRATLRLAFLAAAAGVLYILLSVNNAARLRRKAALKSSLDRLLDEAISDHLRFSASDSSVGAVHDLQDSLTCFTKGAWVASQKHHRFTQETERSKALSYSFMSSCPVRNTVPIADLCSSLVAKQVLFIGPETTYYLHSLWLDALQTHENRSMSCHGPQFCTFHHICRSPSNDTESAAYNHNRFKKFPRAEELLATNSSILRYVLSTTLHAAPNAKDDAYILPTVDPITGVRVKNAYWLAHAKRAHLIIMNRGPLPAPAWTYEHGTSSGNWSFADNLYLNRSSAYVDDAAHSLAVRVINAALHTTLTAFLPFTLQSLRMIGSHEAIRRKLLVWHGSWYIQPRCLVRNKAKTAFAMKDSLDPLLYVDPWTLYYNAQVYMQNRLMHELLPYYGVIFYAQGVPEPPEDDDHPVVLGRRRHVGDCLLYSATTKHGKAMQSTFLRGLVKLLEESMAGSVDVGD